MKIKGILYYKINSRSHLFVWKKKKTNFLCKGRSQEHCFNNLIEDISNKVTKKYSRKYEFLLYHRSYLEIYFGRIITIIDGKIRRRKKKPR
jgi:hypothetical protein